MTKTGLNPEDFDKTVRPQDDLFQYVNGGWLKNNEIPEDRARYGAFHKLADQAELAVKEIIADAVNADTGTPERQVGDLYTSFMDEDQIEKLGWTPITGYLAEIDALSSKAEFLQLLGKYEREGVAGVIQIFVDNDPGNPSRYLPFVEQSGLGLPDENYYREEQFAEVREKYQDHIRRMLLAAGLPDSSDKAQSVYRLEQKIAENHWDNVRCRDSQATYNLVDFADLQDDSAEVAEILGSVSQGTGVFDTVIVRQPSFLTGLAKLLSTEPLSAWQAWLFWHIIRNHASYLHKEAAETNFDFYGRTLTGTPKMRPRWKRGISFVEGSLGDSVGRIYAEKYFPAESKIAMDKLIADLLAAYRQSITNLEWMTPATRAKAIEKLDKFTPKIGAPVKWKDYSNIDISPSDLAANMRAVSAWQFAHELGKIGKPIDRDEWFMLPQTVNAYYNPGFNEIVFPAAILQLPFFSPDRDAAYNYGGIGAVIGHEIGHGFDDQGAQFDGDGKLNNWWSETDLAAFKTRTQSLIDQYSALSPAQTPGQFVNGELTIGENIGDLGGLGIAWQAYLISLAGAKPPVVDGLTAAERFFLSWAACWRQKSRDEEVARLLAIDPHSPAEFRANQVVRNLDEFYTAFGVTESDVLWLPLEKRVTIW